MSKRAKNAAGALFLAAFLLAPCVAAAEGTTGAIFLAIGIGARPEAMGGAYAAVADDANAVNINPAGMTQVVGREVTVMHNEYLLDLNQEYVSYVSGTGRRAWGGSVVYLDMGVQTEYTTANQPGGTFHPDSFALTAAYAKQASLNASWGVNLKYVREKIAGYKGTAFALDAGLLYAPEGSPWRAGIVLQNLGTRIKLGDNSDPLPLTLRVGAAYQLRDYPLLIAGDLYFIKNSDAEFHFGAEYRLADVVGLRLGYNSDDDLDSGFTFGVGFRQETYALDYAFVPMGDFGDSHRFSLSMTF
ncbi:MAG: PorV/PorQ family protein [bacterium]